MAESDTEMTAVQMCLIAGFYRCDDCGQLCDRLCKLARFRLCDACWDRAAHHIPAGVTVSNGSPEQAAIARYAKWREDMERRVPPRRTPGHVARTRRLSALSITADEFYPLCACGERRRERVYGSRAHRRGLFGGPFFDLCPVCTIKQEVEGYVKMGGRLHPEWDDEEWLDLLYKAIPDAFKLGVLPGYWFELKRPAS